VPGNFYTPKKVVVDPDGHVVVHCGGRTTRRLVAHMAHGVPVVFQRRGCGASIFLSGFQHLSNDHA